MDFGTKKPQHYVNSVFQENIFRCGVILLTIDKLLEKNGPNN